MKTFALVVAALAGSASTTLGALSFTGPALSENFDGLPAANVAGAFSATIGLHNAVPSLPEWFATKIAGTGTTATALTASDGSSNSGAMFSYAATASPADRALGTLASGSNVFAFGTEIVNNTGGLLTEITISFDREQYRSSTTTQNVLNFAYGFSGGAVTSSNYLSDAGMTADATGNVVGDAAVATNGVLVPPTTAAVSFTITGLSWGAGQSLFIRWSDTNDFGNDAGLAIDNFTFNAVPTPGSLALLGLGGLVASRRRRA
ncbi:MAG TPA: hypothetical protein VHN77_14955 [Phycisphaerales bacterium]|nr:hypothetical protein [Phycisphaerales bacterium]